MKTILIFIVCCFGLPTLVAAQQRVLLEYLSSQQSGIVPEAHRYIEELEQEFGDRLIPMIYYTHATTFAADVMNDISMEYRIGLPIQTITAGINRRRDVFPSLDYKGMTVERWHPFITSLLQEEPILEIVPRRMQYDNSTGMSIFKVEYSIIWHKPDSNIFLNFILLQDSMQGARRILRQRNNFDTVQGHPYFGKGGVIEDYMARNVAIAGLNSGYASNWGGDTLNYAGQDTVHMVKFSNFYFFGPEIFSYTSDSTKYRFIIYACKVQRYFSHPNIVDSSHVPIINVARIEGRDFEFNTITSVNEQRNNANTLAPLQIHPNPASSWVTVRHPDGLQGAVISITDILGRTVAQHNVGLGLNSQISLAHIPNGVYSVQLRHNNILQTATLLVRK